VKLNKRLTRHQWLVAFLVLYLFSLATFVFFPRPILESGDPLAIAEFIKTHSNFFYKILYADAQKVSLANFFMLTPFVLLARLAFPITKLINIALAGIGISLNIELIQILIPGRVPDLQDFISNSVSILIGIYVLVLRRHFTQKSPKY
jgi:VanZ family protein